jgi:quercetin dioxygenase-like cupin family protein
MPELSSTTRWKIADFSQIDGVPCPCGTARRAFHGVPEFPGTLHVTEISENAKKHYHKKLTETYYFLECGPDAKMELDDQIIDVQPGTAIVIPPGVRHRALGRMKVLIVVLPEFDPHDEWLDDEAE